MEAYPQEIGGGPGTMAIWIGWTYKLAGDQDTANRWLEQALSQVDSAELPTRRVDLSFHYEKRAYTLALLGRKEEALKDVQKALAIVPRSLSSVDWARNAWESSILMLHLGDTQSGLRLMEQVLNPPTQIMPYEFWFHFLALSLHANPEFRELMARHGVDVTRDPAAEYAASQAAAAQTQ
jgi:tetratricopeptide (TPR) repeat protein